jgi:tetratricopeptide (TPR) repeat protein
LRCQALLAWAKCAGIFDSDVPTVLEADVVATQEALALAQQLGERSLEIIAMLEQARACMLLERPDAAARLAEECLVLADLDGSAELCGRAHALLGAAAGDDDDRALAHHLEALGCFREAGNRVMECTVLMLIAINGWESRQRVSDGRSALEMALGLADQLGSAGQRVYLWGNLSLACAILDDYEAAEAYCRRNLRSVRRLGMTRGFLTYDMLVMSHCAAHKGDAAVATQLAGASDAFWTDVARPAEFILTPMELDLIARNKAHLRGVLGESEFERLFSDGQRLSVDQAVDLALWRVPSAE